MVAAALASANAAQPVYFPDDPIAVDPETQDAGNVREWALSDPYDFVENTFFKPGDRTPRRALNINTIDEVPDSSWFTNRAGVKPLTAEEVRRGPDTTSGPAPGKWTVVSGKSDGVTPGFTIRDSANVMWFIKFDPESNPEMATGAEMVATKLFWALGFHVPENHLAVLRRDNLVVGDTATIRDLTGRKRKLTEGDVDELLTRGARNDDDTFRVIASKALAGKPVGPYRYYGTRPDDPNDIHPHEHHRELRGLRVFSAWLNHDDSRSINSLDTIVERDGRKMLWHHLIDFGSTLGSASLYAQKPRAGNEYIWEARPTVITALTLGLYVRPWIRVEYPDIKSLGNIEASFFQPEAWKPEYPNQAFLNAQADDLFWAARKTMAISDEAIRAAVESAEIFRSRGHQLPGGRHHRAARQDRPHLAERRQPAGRFPAVAERRVQQPEHRRGHAARPPRRVVSGALGPLRQRHGQGDPGRRAADGDAAALSGAGSHSRQRLRAAGDLLDVEGQSGMGDAGARAVPPRGRWLAAGRRSAHPGTGRVG